MERIHRVPLQTTNFNRLLVIAVIDARAFAKHVHGTNSRAARAQNIRVQNRERGTPQISLGDLFDESRHVNVCGASSGAWSVEAIQTPIRFGNRRDLIKRRMNLRESRDKLRVCFASVGRGHTTLLGDATSCFDFPGAPWPSAFHQRFVHVRPAVAEKLPGFANLGNPGRRASATTTNRAHFSINLACRYYISATPEKDNSFARCS
jgi:hypothetical protein